MHRMEDTLKFSGAMEQSSQSRKDYVEFHAERPIINKLHDNLKMEGDVDFQTAYMQSYVQKAEPVRPEIKRMHSTLAVAGGDFATESVVKADYPRPAADHRQTGRPIAEQRFLLGE
jgi:hypothetical protein